MARRLVCRPAGRERPDGQALKMIDANLVGGRPRSVRYGGGGGDLLAGDSSPASANNKCARRGWCAFGAPLPPPARSRLTIEVQRRRRRRRPTDEPGRPRKTKTDERERPAGDGNLASPLRINRRGPRAKSLSRDRAMSGQAGRRQSKAAQGGHLLRPPREVKALERWARAAATARLVKSRPARRRRRRRRSIGRLKRRHDNGEQSRESGRELLLFFVCKQRTG
jgi:hypothetical protein